MLKDELLDAKMRSALEDLDALKKSIDHQISLTKNLIECACHQHQVIPEILQPGDIVEFPRLEEMVIMKQQTRPGGQNFDFLVAARRNDTMSFVRINMIRYRPYTNENCISYFQRELVDAPNVAAALEKLSGKTIKCIGHTIDKVPVFSPGGTIQYTTHIGDNGEIVAEPLLRPKFVPVVIEKR